MEILNNKDEKLNIENNKEVKKESNANYNFKRKIQEQAQNVDKQMNEEQRLPDYILEQRQLRKAKPKFALKDLYVDEGDLEVYEYYEGTDITTGEIIRLNQTTHKLVNNKYLYKAFLSTTDNEKAKPIKSKVPQGNAVIFELPFKLASVDKKQDMKTIMAVLELLSKNSQVQLEKNKMKYIGRIENGKVERDSISSQIIKREVVREIYRYQQLMGKENEK